MSFRWNGGNGLWAVGGNWNFDGMPSALVPGAADVAIIDAPGVYAVTLGTVTAGLVSVVDPDATLRVFGNLVSPVVSNAGTIASAAVGAGLAATYLDNSGVIRVYALTAGTASSPSNVGTFSNTGTISFLGSAGTFDDYASGTTAGLGTITGAAAFNMRGTLDNSGATLATDRFGSMSLLEAKVIGGTIDARAVPLAIKGAVLDGVTLRGTINSRSDPGDETIDVLNMLSFQPISGGQNSHLTLGFTTLKLPTSQLANVDITLLSTSFGPSQPVIAVAGVLTLAANTTMTAQQYSYWAGFGPGTAVLNTQAGAAGTIVANGTIAVTSAGLDITVGSFFNNGVLRTASGSHMRLAPTDALFSNTGTVLANGGTITVVSDIAGVGEVDIGNGGTVDVFGTYDTQTIRFLPGGGVLRLDAPGGAPTLLGFNPASTIDLVGLSATAVFAGGTLSIDSGGATVARFVMPDQPAGTTFLATSDGAGGTVITAAPCFAAGTRIATARGPVAVEALRVGDLTLLARGGTAPVQWIGHRRILCDGHPRPWDVQPILVAAHAFAPDRPVRDLLLSPDHAVAVGGLLVPIRHLVNGATIRRDDVEAVTYFHVELPGHDVLLAENLPCESYLDTGNRGAFANGGAVIDLHADFALPDFALPDFALHVWAARGCLPLLRSGRRLAALRRRLRARAERLGHVATMDARICLRAGTTVIWPEVAGPLLRFRLPAWACAVRLCSRSAIPGEADPRRGDPRRLGIAIARIRADGHDVPLDDARLSSGWHAPEPTGRAAWRWTDGDAGLALAGVVLLECTVAMTERYWAPQAAA